MVCCTKSHFSQIWTGVQHKHVIVRFFIVDAECCWHCAVCSWSKIQICIRLKILKSVFLLFDGSNSREREASSKQAPQGPTQSTKGPTTTQSAKQPTHPLITAPSRTEALRDQHCNNKSTTGMQHYLSKLRYGELPQSTQQLLCMRCLDDHRQCLPSSAQDFGALLWITRRQRSDQ